MPYNPEDFEDVTGSAAMAPSELQPPLNFADGGQVNWASDAQIYNTQSQVGNLAATPGGFGGMANQFTMGGPFGQPAPVSPRDTSSTPVHNMAGGSDQFDYNLGSVLQPKPVAPSATLPNMPPMSAPVAMAKGGSVSSLISKLKDEFSKRGLDFDKAMAQRLARKGQGGDTMLAHINPHEAQMLKQAGGSGKINPHTGLMQFDEEGRASQGRDSESSTNDSAPSQSETVNAYEGRSTPAERETSYTGGGGGGGDRGFTSTDMYSGTTAGAPTNFGDLNTGIVPVGSFNPFESFSILPQGATQQQIFDAAQKANPYSSSSNPNYPGPTVNIMSGEGVPTLVGLATMGVPTPQARPTETEIQEAPLAPTASDLSVYGYTPPVAADYSPQKQLAELQNMAGQIRTAQGLNLPTSDQQTVVAANKPAPTSTESAYNIAASMQPPAQPAAIASTDSPFANLTKSIISSAQAQETDPNALIGTPVPNAPFPTPRPTDLAASVEAPPAAPVLPAAKTTASALAKANTPVTNVPPAATTESAPEEQAVVSPIAKVVQAITGQGQKQPYATTSEINDMYENAVPAPGVPLPPIPYRDLGAGNILDNILKPFGLDTESWINKQAAQYEAQGMSPSQAATLASYNLRDVQMNMGKRDGSGGRDMTTQVAAPVAAPVVSPIAQVATPVVPPTATTAWSRKYIPLTDYANYGYGPEATLYEYAAKGGPIGPLSKRK